MKTRTASSGLTLIELLVALVIVSILSLGSVMIFTNSSARVRGAIFNILGDINLARSEAVNRNRDVLVDFTLGSTQGYQLCHDTDEDNDCGNEAAEDIIKEVVFTEEVKFYDCTSAPPYPEEGPTKTPSGTELAGKNGLIFGGPNYFRMQPDGTSSDNGSIIVYSPAPGKPLKIKGSPFAAVISSASTGRVRIMRWWQEGGWAKK